MRKSTLVAVFGVAALGLASGSAVTGGGVTNNATPTEFIGGTVSQSFTGATLSSVLYTRPDAAKQQISVALLTFEADAAGKAVTIAFTAGTPGTFTCDAVAVEAPYTTTCTGSPVAANVTSAAITVS